MKNFSSTVIILLLAIACKEEQLIRDYPTVHTDFATNISIKSVTFTGYFSNAVQVDVIDYGFVWSNSQTQSLETSFSKHLGPASGTTFKSDITEPMPTGMVHVRAFVVTKTSTVYGNVQSFVSPAN
jgi:hypothetical protein